MSRGLASPAGAALALSLVVTLAACGGTASTSAGQHPTRASRGSGPAGARPDGPARDTFSGSIVSATGAYSGDRGRATIHLQPRGPGPRRAFWALIRPACEPSQTHCPTRLTGTLRGTLSSARRSLPDTGDRTNLRGSGHVSPLGMAIATGWIQGTGFIARGHELTRITLRTSSGSVTLEARSGPVKGFTSP